jgi:hypothetical protein
MMPFDQTYNVNWALYECLEHLYEILDFLEDIKLALELGEDIDTLLYSPFDLPQTPHTYETCLPTHLLHPYLLSRTISSLFPPPNSPT